MIVIMAGLPGTGKSTLARELARCTHGAVLSKDEIRSSIFSAEDIEYSIEQDDFVMEIMLDAARYLLQKTPARKIYLDGRTFSRRYQIDCVIAFSRELNQPCKIIECTCSDELARQRLDADDPSHPARNRNFALYLEMKDHFEEISRPKTMIDTSQSPEQCVEQALIAIAAE
jgi:predicted kinase